MEYKLSNVIARSRTSEVWKGYCADLELPLAIKLFSPTIDVEFNDVAAFEQLFFNEAELLCRLQHPQIIRFYDLYETEIGNHGIVMELADGKHLDEVALTPETAGMVAVKILSAINYLQDPLQIGERYYNCIIHGDIKPSNIIITRSGPKLIDFGYSCPDPAINAERILGTPKYSSAEKMAGQMSTWKDDGYALGLSIFETLGFAKPLPGIEPPRPKEVKNNPILKSIWALIQKEYPSPGIAIGAISAHLDKSDFGRHIGGLLRSQQGIVSTKPIEKEV